MLSASEIRSRFLKFFLSQGHEIVRSSSLIPREDPSLLFTNAGMVQFKKVFLGQEKRTYNRATTSQKCLRVGGKHNDLENVGRTARHHTFFEMLGNFSFGNYFKEDAIKFAWRFLTEDLKLPKEKLYATVFQDDDEAEQLWLKHTEVPAERIFRMGEKDNFWSMGDTGPCGPCSEILIDQGEELTCGPNCGIGKCDCDRYLEIWNLVFMQYNQDETGKRTPLPNPSIDTGMGLERIAAVCQNKHSNFDSDLFQAIIQYACTLAPKANLKYSHSSPDTNDIDTALRVIADHSRSAAFMIADGIMPSNEGRGYVLRRLIRRAYRFGRLIGMPECFLYLMAAKVVEVMGADYTELTSSAEFMARVIKEEEERFSKTLDKGLALLEEEFSALKSQNKTCIDGLVAFKLYDTYGFPLDIVNDLASKRGFSVDEDGFKEQMNAQKQRAKAAWKGSGELDLGSRFQTLLEEGLRSEFSGYTQLNDESRIISLMNSETEPVEKLKLKEKGYLVAGRTPFYGASGGQSGDLGLIQTAQGKAKVLDTLKPATEMTVHLIEVIEGEILLDTEVQLQVEEGERIASARNHTCTHLLHAALRSVLGTHVKQAGSLVTPERLRFDFTHIQALTADELLKVEELVNKAILADTPVNSRETSYDDAVANGAMALFGEKYGDKVRMVKVGDFSTELCGGTHLKSSGEAGSFVILSEAGVAAGTRRIEAATGLNALHYLQQLRKEAQEISGLLKAKAGESSIKVQALQEELRAMRKNIDKLADQKLSSAGKNLVDEAVEINGVKVLAIKSGANNVPTLRKVMDDVRSKINSGVICLTAEEEGKVHLILFVSPDLHQRFTAPSLIKELAPLIGASGGGGRPDQAQTGGNNPSGQEECFEKLKGLIKG
ncbi:alanine--tRNA ligase [Desulfovibrio litoralis]|uniref:Alanine--tRNA ligase n=1 Tax=Desulfovibrio litoralis DSM 11393 TaxID=1121455 RepID=A0A1M7TDC2_9BACT|nr:alanine--tRNA ligase [Desulfovibrio litoralis]SHN68693.1 alanyl-tRNA synthetase [Desulfovibrio litoralis DSM 11393]